MQNQPTHPPSRMPATCPHADGNMSATASGVRIYDADVRAAFTSRVASLKKSALIQRHFTPFELSTDI